MCFLSDFKLAEIAVNSNFYSWAVLCDELTHALAAELSMQMWIHIESIFGRRPTWVNVVCVRKSVFSVILNSQKLQLLVKVIFCVGFAMVNVLN